MGKVPTVEEVKATCKKWVLRLHPGKNTKNVARATNLLKGLNAHYEDWKRVPMRALPKGTLPAHRGCAAGKG